MRDRPEQEPREQLGVAAEEVHGPIQKFFLVRPHLRWRPRKLIGRNRPDVGPVVTPPVQEVNVEVAFEDISEKLNWEMVDAEGRRVSVWRPSGGRIQGHPDWAEPPTPRGVERVVRVAAVAGKPYTQLRWRLSM